VKTLLLANILSQPSALQAVGSYQLGAGFGALTRSADLLRGSKRIVLTGMGASLFACTPLRYMLGRHGVNVSVVEAAELLHFLAPTLDGGTAVVLVSRSGESIEVLKLLDLLNDRGCHAVGVANVPESSLVARTTEPVILNSPSDQLVAIQTYTATLLTLTLLGAAYLDELNAAKTELGLLQTLLPRWIEQCLHASETWKQFAHRDAPLYIMGRGAALASVDEGVLLMHEIAKSPAVGMSIAQFRHGPVEATDERFRAIVIGTQRVTAEIDRQFAEDLCRMGGDVRWLGPLAHDAAIVPLCSWLETVPERFASVFETVPLQLLAYRAAEAQGMTPGQFRWASTVTNSESGFPGLEESLRS
jgi:glutamine---fructose-6-phosphate transaminase (isomerizing)